MATYLWTHFVSDCVHPATSTGCLCGTFVTCGLFCQRYEVLCRNQFAAWRPMFLLLLDIHCLHVLQCDLQYFDTCGVPTRQ